MPKDIRGTRGMAGLVVPPWFAATSRQLPWRLEKEEGLPGPVTPGNGGHRRHLLARGTRVRGAARRSCRNDSGAVSQQHGSLVHRWSFLPVLVNALVSAQRSAVRSPILPMRGAFVEGNRNQHLRSGGLVTRNPCEWARNSNVLLCHKPGGHCCGKSSATTDRYIINTL